MSVPANVVSRQTGGSVTELFRCSSADPGFPPDLTSRFDHCWIIGVCLSKTE
jgi:hypothetical protein